MNSNPKAKKLTRSRDDRFIGGVAAGIAHHLNVDPVIVRIAFVVSIIFGGIGVLAYLILLAAVPIEGDPNEPAPQLDGPKRIWVIGGTSLIGVLALVSIGVGGGGFGGWLFGFAQGFWFGALIWALAIGGVYWLLQESKDEKAEPAKAASEAETGAAPASTQATRIAPSPTQNAPATPPAPTAPATETAVPPGAIAGDAPTTENPRTAETKVMPATVKSSDVPSTFGKVMTILAIIASAALGAIILASISSLSTVVFGGIPMAAVVILLGVGLVVAALNDRHAVALWVLGAAVAVTIPMAIISIADLRVDGDFGEVREAPEFAGAIPGDGYQLAAGAMTIDMRNFPFRDGQTVDLPVESGLGATRVIVPDDVCVSGAVKGKAGLAEVRGLESSGVSFDRTFGNGLSSSAVLNVDSDMKVGFFQIIDNTTRMETAGPREGDWGSTVDRPRLQDEARDRALKACSEPTRKPVPPPPSPKKPGVSSPAAAKGTA